MKVKIFLGVVFAIMMIGFILPSMISSSHTELVIGGVLLIALCVYFFWSKGYDQIVALFKEEPSKEEEKK